MTSLLIRLFIKNSDQVKDHKVRESYGKMAWHRRHLLQRPFERRQNHRRMAV